MVWLLQFGQLVVLSVKMCGMAVTIWSTCCFERKLCGMAVIIWSTFGFEPKYFVWLFQLGQLVVLCVKMWYGCYNLVNLCVCLL